MATLKANIQELQAALAREKEFNGATNSINTEYLVNVMRKFLQSENPSERASLVVAITQLLHLRADESKQIVDKWAVKAPGGLVGWFTSKPAAQAPAPAPAPAPAGQIAGAASSFGPPVDGPGGLY